MAPTSTFDNSINSRPTTVLIQEEALRLIAEEVAFTIGCVLLDASHSRRIRRYLDDMAHACQHELREPFETHARRGLFENYCPETGLFESLETSLIYYLTRRLTFHPQAYHRLKWIEQTRFPNLSGDTILHFLDEDQPLWLEKTISH